MAAMTRRTPRPSPPDRPLNDRELRFVTEYRSHVSVWQASYAAGYSEWMGCKLIKRPDIQGRSRRRRGPWRSSRSLPK